MKRLATLTLALTMAVAGNLVSVAGDITCDVTEFLYGRGFPGFQTLGEATDDALGPAQVDEVASGTKTVSTNVVTVDGGASDYLFAVNAEHRYSLVIYSVCTGPVSASAHSQSNWYDEHWPGASPNVHWKFTQEVNGSDKRASITAGANKWDNAGTADFKFTNDTPDAADFGFDNANCLALDNTVHWEAISGSALAKARTCSIGNDIEEFAIGFDSGENWYVGSGNPASNENDVRSVSTHEFGHATGGWLNDTLGHWDEGGEGQLCPEDSTKHTMCSTITTGETWGRTIESHDQHTFANAY